MRNLIALSAALACLSGAAWAGPPCTVPNAVGSYNFDTCGNQVVNTGAPGSGGTVTANPPAPITYATSPDSYSVGTSSAQLFAAGAYSNVAFLRTLTSQSCNVWLNIHGGTAAVGTGIEVTSAGGWVSFGSEGLPIPTAAVFAISDNGTCTLAAAGK